MKLTPTQKNLIESFLSLRSKEYSIYEKAPYLVFEADSPTKFLVRLVIFLMTYDEQELAEYLAEKYKIDGILVEFAGIQPMN